MAERITLEDLDRIAGTVSEGLADGFEVRVQGRNGYKGLDLYGPDGRMRDTLHLGSAREVYTYLQGMRRAHLLRRAGE